MDRFDGLETFVQVADSGSFVEAGRVLGLSASAVGKAVARLEQRLGARLFQRTTRQMSLTEDGELLYRHCRVVLDELGEAETALSRRSKAPRGRLRIGLPVIGYRFLMPVLPDFARAYPEVELELEFDDRIVDVVEAGLDAVIRSGSLPDSRLISRRLGPFRIMLCAAPSYLAARGTPRRPEELGGHACIRFRFPTTGRLQDWPLRGTFGPAVYQVASGLICNNMEGVRSAAIAGLGIASMPDFVACDALARGDLRQVLAAYEPDPGQFSLLWPSSRHLSPRVRAFADFTAGRLFPAEGAALRGDGRVPAPSLTPPPGM